MKPNLAAAMMIGLLSGVDIGGGGLRQQERRAPPSKLNRSDEDIQSRLDKQSAKLARRAKRAGFEQK